MNRDQSIKLWLKGKDAWNKWADKLLKEKQALIDSGDWQAEKQMGSVGILVGKNDKTKNWFDRANTDFSSLWLRPIDQPEGGEQVEPEKSNDRKSIPLDQSNVSFEKFVFPANVTFHNTLFDCGDASFRSAQFSRGDASFSDAQFSGGSASFLDAQFSGGDASFRGAQFSHGSAYFGNAQFSGGSASFRGAQFGGGSASFRGAQFSGGDAIFDDARFSGGDAYFNDAQFSGGDAGFDSAQFSGGNANFINTCFSKDATFNLAIFEKPATFEEAVFKNNADFSSLDSKKSFALTNTKFHQVPDFTESSFHEPPVLDDIQIEKALPETHWKIFGKANGTDDTKKYRKLSKMASEAKDYQNEMKFFADEQRCRRFCHDQPFGKNMGRFWFGLLYDKLSNYGRSFWHPLLGWLSIFGVFAFLYASQATNIKWAWGSALYVSFRHGLIFSGLTRSDSWDSAIEKLFGKGDNLDIPTLITWAMAFQPLLSAVFIFLFLLALRNQFKIR